MFATAVQYFQQWYERLYRWQRFELWFKILLMAPIALWLIIFQGVAAVPNSFRPQIDVTTLPKLESVVLLGFDLQRFPRDLIDSDWIVTAMDVFAAFLYLIHFGFSWVYAFGLLLYYRRNRSALFSLTEIKVEHVQPWAFLFCLGLLNIAAVLTQFALPTAPPWYNTYYGDQPANYSMKGDAAGLHRADEILGYPLFQGMYGSSPVVFGSWPSLHAAWPIMIALFTPVCKPLFWMYPPLVWWAAVYLNHHYVVDLLGGLLYCLIAYKVGTLIVRKLISSERFKAMLHRKALRQEFWDLEHMPKAMQHHEHEEHELQVVYAAH